MVEGDATQLFLLLPVTSSSSLCLPAGVARAAAAAAPWYPKSSWQVKEQGEEPTNVEWLLLWLLLLLPPLDGAATTSSPPCTIAAVPAFSMEHAGGSIGGGNWDIPGSNQMPGWLL